MLSRRHFLAASTLALTGAPLLARAQPKPPTLPITTLGTTGRAIPRLALGCFPLGNLPKDEDGVAIARLALDLGVRYLDTAPSYNSGRSERLVGRAVAEWLKADPANKRADLFLATKTLRRDAEGAHRELEQSLKNMGVEYLDSVQCHEVHDDWESLFAKGGVLEALEKAKTEGLIRHIGITGHRNPAYLVSAVNRYDFATALVPVNPVDVQHMSFVRGFLPTAVDRKVGVIAMKVFGGGFLLNHKTPEGATAYTPADLLSYALSQPGVVAADPGCDKPEHVRTDFDAVVAFKPLDAQQLRALEAKAPKHQGKQTEWYKEGEPATPKDAAAPDTGR
ncbi:Aldo-keto reductase YhdN [Phycisphaerales bacterium]|nr:Aldo-keto reductase YhdN [Phycisphaerales bacterium]